MVDKTEDRSVLLSCDSVTKNFGALVAVNNLSFEVKVGTVFGIGGPNGAGKTTLYDVITGVSPISSGKINFNGKSITNLQPHEICHAGIARTFQLNAAFETMSVIDNVLISAHHGNTKNKVIKVNYTNEERQRADYALEVCGLSDKAKYIVSSLNLVEHKLLMIAAAVATKPLLLLMDEPVGGLIPKEIDKVERVVRNLISTHNMTVVLIEHVMRFLVSLSDEVLIMNYGEKLYHGSPEGLTDDKEVVEVYLGEGMSAQIGTGVKGKASTANKETELKGDLSKRSQWAIDVELASRQLLRQYLSGFVYPIDFLKVERLLDSQPETEKSTNVSRAAKEIISAQVDKEDMSPHFEWLRRVFDESYKIRDGETAKAKNNQSDDTIEIAVRDFLAKETNGFTNSDIEKLREAVNSSRANNG